jgi:hypothetical protein
MDDTSCWVGFGWIELRLVISLHSLWISITLHHHEFVLPKPFYSNFLFLLSLSIPLSFHSCSTGTRLVVTCRPIPHPKATQTTICSQPPDRTATYGHRIKKARVPVRSLTDKLDIGGLVVGWVTTSESPLLYVFIFIFFIA